MPSHFVLITVLILSRAFGMSLFIFSQALLIFLRTSSNLSLVVFLISSHVFPRDVLISAHFLDVDSEMFSQALPIAAFIFSNFSDAADLIFSQASARESLILPHFSTAEDLMSSHARFMKSASSFGFVVKNLTIEFQTLEMPFRRPSIRNPPISARLPPLFVSIRRARKAVSRTLTRLCSGVSGRSRGNMMPS